MFGVGVHCSSVKRSRLSGSVLPDMDQRNYCFDNSSVFDLRDLCRTAGLTNSTKIDNIGHSRIYVPKWGVLQ